ncbi:hypothetical protein A3E39_04480 [Candidatus Uhrbacteria bacterium RIFCSPHIGHO2_12_FULL_60_25]|uniref:POTRA domain-containing protein n=1 Tax=Candidatus Uhrbacteria bacterium RIFCSPHIGHO2_12_FULL_60_25 TaxID=1802399 RepID=A0A1F7UIR3_9BACT|nr:MAG: hypothetical protein A3D73_01030 [Candidatus Uhrbacteria bacterium RIFCSPHIGHO2_02_FULL_60_44]OGL78143.1 MAG: hypothetical protein A3E39_04480 [Candidatus Uhrbacteria bacterium RIFCSPHIGHO2_12_FULL_60_25]
MKWPSRIGREEGTFAGERYVTTTKRRRVVVAFLAVVAVVGWLYVFFGSGIFTVSTVDIGDVSDLERGEVMKEVYASLDEQGTWSRRNLLLVNSSALSHDLEQRLFAEEVAVEKSYPSVLRLNIRERQSSLILVTGNEFFLLDRRGMVAKRITTEEEEQILKRIAKPSPTKSDDAPILTLRESPLFVPGEPLVDQVIVETWLRAFQDLSKAGFGYRNAILETSTSTKLVLNMYEPYDVYVDLLTSMQDQIQSYYVFSKSLPPGTRIYSYVDARIPGRIYYK